MRSARFHTPVLLAVIAVSASLLAAPSASAAAGDAPPDSISVCRSDGSVDVVAFDRYVKVVLGAEWPESWPMETLKAGAVAVKSFAWYYIEHPYRPGRCDITDSTRHQLYDPGDRRTARGDAAVDETWHIRMDEVRSGERTPAYAQYCGANCGGFPEGEALRQYDAKRQGAEGWPATRILEYHYRNKQGLRIFDWRGHFAVHLDGEEPVGAYRDQPLVLTGAVDGVPAGDDDARAHLLVDCTIDGTKKTRRVQTVGIGERNGRAAVRFDRADGLKDCQETELVAEVRLAVDGSPVAADAITVWKPWRSASEREAGRIADTSDPVEVSAQISRKLFADADEAEVPVVGTTRFARAVVIARADMFADALSATGLAGDSAPILLNPGGDAPLDDRVAEEIQRVLPDGATVHIVGGPNAISSEAAADPRLEAYEVVRHAGSSRVGTALAVADAVRERDGDVGSVIVARAYPDTTAGWADAVTGGAYAAARAHPVLLTAPDRLDAGVEAWIESHPVSEAVLLGGQNAVPGDAEERLDVATTRIAGTTRAGTAVEVAERLWSRDGAPRVTGALVVDAYEPETWQFALVGSVWAAVHGTPQLVVTHLVPRHTTGAWLDAHPDLPVGVIGSSRVVTDHVVDAASGR